MVPPPSIQKMAVQMDEDSLQEAIRTTLVQLCKVGVVFQQELTIKGTLGVTVDRRSVILVHFDEKVEGGRCPVDSSQLDAVQVTTSASTVSSSRAADVSSLLNENSPQDLTFKVGMSSTDATSFIRPDTCSGRSAARLFSLGISDSDPIPIDLDSDSESFSALNFDDDNSVQLGVSRDMKNEFMSNDDGYDQADSKEMCDNKKSILQMQQLNEFDTPVSACSEGLSSSVFSAPGLCFQMPGGYTVNQNTGTKLSLKWQDSSSPSCDDHGDKKETKQLNYGVDSFDEGELDRPTPKRAKVQRSNRDWSCPCCDKSMPKQSILESHLVEVHGVTETEQFGSISHFKCEQCPKKFRYQPNLDKHMFLHVENKPYKCYLCSNTYRFQESLNVHMSAHSENSTGHLHCNMCKKSYVSKQLLQKHIIYMHEMRRGSKS